MDYLVYAYLQLGEDANAKAVLDEMNTVTDTSTIAVADAPLADRREAEVPMGGHSGDAHR